MCFIKTQNALADGLCGAWGSSGTNPWTVSSDAGGTASAAYADVNACVNTVAAENDTVNVPAASATWASTLVISNAITIRGQTTCTMDATYDWPTSCDDETVITSNGSTTLISISVSGNKEIDISGLKLNANGSGSAISVSNTATSTPLYDLRLHHLEIKNASGYAVSMEALWWGLMDHILWRDCNYSFKVLNDDSLSGMEYAWCNYPATSNFGTKYYLYIENTNTIGFTTFVNSSGWGSRWVYRHNKADGSATAPGDTFHDIHGDTQNRGVVAVEMYENIYTNAGARRGIDYRGGSLIAYNNSWSSEASVGGYINVREENAECNYVNGCDCDTSTCGDSVQDGYIWNISGVNSLIQEDDANGCIAEKTDWWDDYNNSPEYFTSDVAANRNPSVCTAEDVYWETDNKKLYRCTATNTWTFVYQAYIYPHPVSGNASVTISDDNPKSVESSTTDVTITTNIVSSGRVCKWRLGSAPDASNGTEFSGLNPTITGLSEGANTLYVGCDGASNEYSWGVNDSLTINRGAAASSGKVVMTNINGGNVGVSNINSGNISVTAVY